MTINQRIDLLARLGDRIRDKEAHLITTVYPKAEAQNPWFTIPHCIHAMKTLLETCLDATRLSDFAHQYPIEESAPPKRVGLVLAGNIPMAGFHDILCCFLAGHTALIKVSEKDPVLIPYLLQLLTELEPSAAPYFLLTDRLKDYDAAIATGSDNTARHFQHYFRHVPHILRRNRSSTAILSGDEDNDALSRLGDDIFLYYGLGCRNVSHIWIPENTDIHPLIESLNHRKEVMFHNKYKNNYDYNLALFLLNKEPFLQGDTMLLRESQQPASRIGCLHYSRYTSMDEVYHWVVLHKNQLQCIVSHATIPGISTIPFGTSQCPAIDVFADGVDTMHFLISLTQEDSST